MPSTKYVGIGVTIMIVFIFISYCGLLTIRGNTDLYSFERSTLNDSTEATQASNRFSATSSQTKKTLPLRTIDDHSLREQTPYNRADKTPEETNSLPFLKNFKNPCWRETVGNTNSSRIRCLPYFYSIGPRKCGTTDIHRRLTRHPQISSNVKKEIQWLARGRFTQRSTSKLSKYLQILDKAVSKDIIPSGQNGQHDAIIGDFSPSSSWYNQNYWKSQQPKFTSNADVIHHLNPDTKIIMTIRNPVTRSYSDFKHYSRSNASPQLFHLRVVSSIRDFDRECRNSTKFRRCFDKQMSGTSAFLLIGLYHVYLEDYLRVFPRRQILITKIEDRAKDMKSALKEMFTFLEIKLLSDEIVEDIDEQKVANKNTRSVPDMYEKTRLILEDFYKPFNEKLGKLIGQKFNYNMNK